MKYIIIFPPNYWNRKGSDVKILAFAGEIEIIVIIRRYCRQNSVQGLKSQSFYRTF